MRLRFLLVGVVFGLVACGDGAPRWEEQTQLVGSEITGTTVVLEWPVPEDADGIKAYSIRQNDTLLAQIEGTVTRYKAENLAGMTEYRFEVAAQDKKGNWSAPLKKAFKTGDAEAPTWSAQAEVETSIESKGPLGTAVTFTWTEALDNVAVTGYRVVREEDGELLGEVAAAGREFVHQSIDVDGRYRVEARDEAGNWSSGGPTARVWANKGLRPMLRSQGFLRQPVQGFEPPALPLMQAPTLGTQE